MSDSKTLRKPCKVAILIPAGTVADRDHVVSYHRGDAQQIVNTNLNVGDTFVFEASLRLIDFDEAVYIPTGIADIDATVESLNRCDFAILRGSNYIHANMNWGQLPLAIEKSRVPVIAFGIGVQAPRYQEVPVSEETERFMRLVSERCHSVGCRGAFTAEILSAFGVRNAVPIGCPSLFRRNDRDLQIALPAAAEIRRVAFTLARGLFGMYCDAPAVARAKQQKLLEELQRRYDVYIITQGEKSEKIFYYRIYERIEEAKTLMRTSGWDVEKMPWLEQLYWSRMFFGTTPTDYEAIMAFCDMAIGYRLHGNIMALSIGKPAFYHTFDSRTRELVEHFHIPSYDVMDEAEFVVDTMLSEEAFARCNARLPHAYDEMRDFLIANGVPHRMSSPVPAGIADPPPVS